MAEMGNKKLARMIYENNLSKPVASSYKSLSEQVYEIIKNKIIYRELKPGERIIDKHLAEELDVSRSLVRQAFTILEKEELITSIPRSGFYVREITKQDVAEIYNIRKLLETYATELAVDKLSEEDIAEADEIFEKAKQDLEEGRVEKFIEADSKLHEILIDNCGNDRLKKMINKYNTHYIFYRIIDLSTVERAKEAYEEHYEIFKAVQKRDVEEAVRLMGEHVERARDIILQNFADYTFGN
ncbi:GntR family transcriptional regulator [Fuchsiella alkaliacetigena]|uniref:GntR family transcriptional regulator n=1 Tax=Fuchsiella alkaliacetigena TaxID=957042 RepID=UPI00200A43CA|nr:GntR family transcriptional regulator [Fuchsiella alkaliacetigena]MCK8824221.1 GntR family transcriptional regulator [Fuchsiella alkaliacetigena]